MENPLSVLIIQWKKKEKKIDANELLKPFFQEVEALKEEITLLSRKGGHILPPAQPPLPPSAQPRQPVLPNT